VLKRVPGAGLEPARLVQGRRILSPLCLPISPSGRNEVQARKSNRRPRLRKPLHFVIADSKAQEERPSTRIRASRYSF
jgi:hypothetical protein